VREAELTPSARHLIHDPGLDRVRMMVRCDAAPPPSTLTPRAELREYSPGQERPEPDALAVMTAINRVLTDWLGRPGDGPFYSTVTGEDGARWIVTAKAALEGPGLEWRVELGGRRWLAGQVSRPHG
jgi:hypothetical protein